MSQNDQTAEPQRLNIRKYPNRRYYDTTRSCHLTLEEIYALIRAGHEVQVTDSKSGKDITAKILAQIIIELDSPKLDVFPVPLLHRLLRSNERIVRDFADKYFNQPLSAFLDQQRNMEQYFRQARLGGTVARIVPCGTPSSRCAITKTSFHNRASRCDSIFGR